MDWMPLFRRGGDAMKNIPVPRRDSRCTAERCLSMPRVDTTRAERARGNNVPDESDFKLKTRSLSSHYVGTRPAGHTRERRTEEKLTLFNEKRADGKLWWNVRYDLEQYARLGMEQSRATGIDDYVTRRDT